MNMLYSTSSLSILEFLWKFSQSTPMANTKFAFPQKSAKFFHVSTPIFALSVTLVSAFES